MVAWRRGCAGGHTAAVRLELLHMGSVVFSYSVPLFLHHHVVLLMSDFDNALRPSSVFHWPVQGLLTRDPAKRLGNGPNGSAAIRAHAFFKVG